MASSPKYLIGILAALKPPAICGAFFCDISYFIGRLDEVL